jgi:hypothetical protein
MGNQIYNNACATIIIIYRVFYKDNGTLKKASILSYGINKIGDSKCLNAGIHAEHDAIRKLLPLKNKKRLKAVSILVIRLSVKNKLQSSKPCSNCIEIMKNLPIKIGYKIKDVYYSDNEGNIVKTNLNNLDNEEKHYSSFYRKRHTNLFN